MPEDRDALACENTDRELWREREGDYYANSIHVTKGGGIGINVGGHVIVRPLVEWHASILPPTTSAGDGELVEHLQERLLNEQMLAFKWMDAHDKLKAGKPYSFPAPADLPDALARVKELEEALTAAEAKTREEDARIAEQMHTIDPLGDYYRGKDIAIAIRSRIPETDNGR